MIRYILGTILKIEGALLLLPCLIALIYREREGFVYLIFALIGLVLGILFSRKKPANTMIYLKEGCIATSLSWIVLSFFGCLPFIFTGEIPHFTDAMFETVSGFTTTGASILSNVEGLTHCSLFWRSFTHWIGGMGVLVFLLAVIPMSGGSNINLMRAESPGPSVGKLVPKLVHTARILYIIYFGLTILQMVFLLFGGMPIFDALCTSVGTAGTGGFGIKNDSMASYSPYIQWVVTIFMILFGVNFNAYYYLLFKQVKKALSMEEVRTYFLIILSAVVIITFDILRMAEGVFDAITHAAFQVASIITTSGFATTDFDLWPQTSRIVLVLLMFCGACAGSTGGGIKVSRFIIAIESALREIHSYIHPKSVKKLKFEGKTIDQNVIHSVNVYFITFLMLFILSIVFVSLEGKDLVTNFTAVAATINNIGPGLALVGPTCNFGHFTDFSKWVLIFDMLAGRLELFPLLLLFHPTIWKDSIKSITTHKK
jgi:trk system potassium uptake protein TrkH